MLGSEWSSPLIESISAKVICKMELEIDPFNNAANSVTKYAKIVGVCVLVATTAYVLSKSDQ